MSEAERESKEAQLRELKYKYLKVRKECKKKDTFNQGLLQLYFGSFTKNKDVYTEGLGNMGGAVMSYSECRDKKNALITKINRLEKELSR